MKKINKDHWEPSNGLKLEDNALEIAKSEYHSLVIAGPGAGKTELLAQRASYLLQTNECQYPKKVLAISFKADAAYNLKERVLLRCGNELSKRFDSLTFDAFAKSIFDRFKSALPSKFLIKNKYTVAVTDQNVLDEFKFNEIYFFNSNNKNQIINFFYEPQLPYVISNNQEKLKDKIWMDTLSSAHPQLPFKTIMRLAELIITTNPLIKSYLQKTYKYVFLDEFQDTTVIQYEFLRNCFFDSTSIITAVGDDKQRIMTWAGAKETAFSDLKKDINSKEVPLFMNFRSAPRLVALQNYLVENLLKKTDIATASPKWNLEDGQCNIWIFDNPDVEKDYLLTSVKKWIKEDNISPRDICILVKQQLNVYVGDLIDYFNSNGVKARDENEIQNFLSEGLILYFIDALYCTFDKRASIEHQSFFHFIQSLYGYESDNELISLEVRINDLKNEILETFRKQSISKNDINETIEKILNFAGSERIKSEYQKYDEPYFKYLITNFVDLFFSEYEITKNVIDSLNNILGKETIPVMTVHKSKGLEYNTVIFVGLEDNAFWSYQNQPNEDRCTFFVALSRAKNRVVFTFSKMRYDKFNRPRNQNIEKIKDILEGLNDSGLVVIEEKK